MLTTDRLILRKPAEADIDTIFEIHSDPRTNVHNPAGPIKRRSDAVQLLRDWEQRWLEYNYGYWTVNSAVPERVIGFGGVMKTQIAPGFFDNNVYFRFRPEVWGQSYASEMVSAALERTFNEMAQKHVFGVARSYNTASRKTLERTGFELVGTVEDIAGDAPSVLYSLRRSAFQQQRAAKPC